MRKNRRKAVPPVRLSAKYPWDVSKGRSPSIFNLLGPKHPENRPGGECVQRNEACHHIREYRCVYGTVKSMTGDNFFLVMPYCSTNCMNTFLEELAKQYPQDQNLLVWDGAAWHKSKMLKVLANITLLGIPPYTPEMNPIEQIWKQLRPMGFRNKVFKTLNHVVDRLCEAICDLNNDMVKSIT